MRVVLVYRDTKAGDYAAGLAFHALLTMFPIFLGLLTVLGLVTRSQDLDLRVEQAIVTSFPLGMQDEVRSALLSLQHSAGTYGLIAVAWLLWAGTRLSKQVTWCRSSARRMARGSRASASSSRTRRAPAQRVPRMSRTEG